MDTAWIIYNGKASPHGTVWFLVAKSHESTMLHRENHSLLIKSSLNLKTGDKKDGFIVTTVNKALERVPGPAEWLSGAKINVMPKGAEKVIEPNLDQLVKCGNLSANLRKAVS